MREFELDSSELLRAFERMIASPSLKFFFVIDGLDEFDGERKIIVDFIKRSARENVKLCVASRPWLTFEDVFRRQPSVRMEHLTKNDISLYITDHFRKNETYLQMEKYKPEVASALLCAMTEKASGVFLWVYLLFQSLLEGLTNADRSSDLQQRINALPSDLTTLFTLILEGLSSEYFRRACETFRLLRLNYDISDSIEMLSGDDPTLLALYYADDQLTTSGQNFKLGDIQAEAAMNQAEQMRRRLNARCKGLLEVRKSQSSTGICSENLYDHKILWLHGTARDFVHSNYWPTVLQNSNSNSFDPYRRWANANLWMLKICASTWFDASRAGYYWACGISYALHLQCQTGIVQATYLDEIFGTVQRQSRFVSTIYLLETYPEHVRYIIVLLSRMPLCADCVRDRELVLQNDDEYDRLQSAQTLQKDDFDPLKEWLKYYQHLSTRRNSSRGAAGGSDQKSRNMYDDVGTFFLYNTLKPYGLYGGGMNRISFLEAGSVAEDLLSELNIGEM